MMLILNFLEKGPTKFLILSRVRAWPKAAAKIFLKSDFLQKVFARVWKLAFWSGEEVFGLSVEAIFGNR